MKTAQDTVNPNRWATFNSEKIYIHEPLATHTKPDVIFSFQKMPFRDEQFTKVIVLTRESIMDIYQDIKRISKFN